jgi:hypothetical protein
MLLISRGYHLNPLIGIALKHVQAGRLLLDPGPNKAAPILTVLPPTADPVKDPGVVCENPKFTPEGHPWGCLHFSPACPSLPIAIQVHQAYQVHDGFQAHSFADPMLNNG